MKTVYLSIVLVMATGCGPISVEIPNATVNEPATTTAQTGEPQTATPESLTPQGASTPKPTPAPTDSCACTVNGNAMAPTPSPSPSSVFDPNDPFDGVYGATTLKLSTDFCGGSCAQTVDVRAVVVTGNGYHYEANGIPTTEYTTGLQWQVLSGVSSCPSDQIIETYVVAHNNRTYTRSETGNCQSGRDACICSYN